MDEFLRIDTVQLSLLVGMVMPFLMGKVVPLLRHATMAARPEEPDRLTQGQRDARTFLIAWGVIEGEEEQL
jgi:hypothetical protein